MSRLNLKSFLHSSTCFFDLRGITENEEDVPCRIKVGSRHVLNVHVKPDRFALDFWGIHNKKPTYLYNHPIPAAYDRDGILFFDATAFLERHTDKGYVECNLEDYRRAQKNLLRPRFVKASAYGVATSFISWTDIMPLVYSYVYLAPGALTICGKAVQCVSWESCSGEDAADGRSILPLVETLLSKPHDLSADDIRRALEDIGGLNYNFISILTDTGSYNMYALWGYSSNVDLPGGYFYFNPARYDPKELTTICLTLMEANSGVEIEERIALMREQGLIAPSPDDD